MIIFKTNQKVVTGLNDRSVNLIPQTMPTQRYETPIEFSSAPPVYTLDGVEGKELNYLEIEQRMNETANGVGKVRRGVGRDVAMSKKSEYYTVNMPSSKNKPHPTGYKYRPPDHQEMLRFQKRIDFGIWNPPARVFDSPVNLI